MILNRYTVVVLIIFLNCWYKICQAVPVEEDLTLTLKEKQALDEFKGLVDQYLPHDYMKSDIYLIRWLRARNLNLNRAKEMLLNSLRWREQNRMDDILNEDFGQLEQEFPATYDGIDYTGRPVVTADASEWDVRKAIVSGQRDAVMRYVYRLEEIGVMKILEQQSKGLNVTQSVVIVNLSGFSIIVHACPQCIAVYVNFVLASENYYPGWAHKLILINTPASFNIILRAVRPVMSKATLEALTIFGNNQQEWKKYLLDMIPADQLDSQFGGFKELKN